MPSVDVDIATTEWASCAPFYGPGAVYQGDDIVQRKIRQYGHAKQALAGSLPIYHPSFAA